MVPAWFKYPHCVTFICLVFCPFFIYQVFMNIFSKPSGSKVKKIQYSCMTKTWLVVAVVLAYSYLMVTSSQSALMWMTLDGSGHDVWCPLLASYRMFSYVSGRSLLYCYFVCRTNDIFNGTYLEFGRVGKYALTVYIMLVIVSLSGPTSVLYFGQSWRIVRDTQGGGTYCESLDSDDVRVKLLFVWGSLNDMTFSVITILMMISRLFLLLTDNERKKSQGKRFEVERIRDSMYPRF